MWWSLVTVLISLTPRCSALPQWIRGGRVRIRVPVLLVTSKCLPKAALSLAFTVAACLSYFSHKSHLMIQHLWNTQQLGGKYSLVYRMMWTFRPVDFSHDFSESLKGHRAWVCSWVVLANVLLAWLSPDACHLLLTIALLKWPKLERELLKKKKCPLKFQRESPAPLKVHCPLIRSSKA